MKGRGTALSERWCPGSSWGGTPGGKRVVWGQRCLTEFESLHYTGRPGESQN